MTWRCGVDVLSFGGTKNGCFAAEAVVVFKGPSAPPTEHFRLMTKRSGHLLSKMRLLSSQLLGYLGNPAAGSSAPWRRGARHGNTMAKTLAAGLETIAAETGAAGIALLQPVQSNEVFFSLPEQVLLGVFDDGHACLDVGALSGKKKRGELLRCVCSWATVEKELWAFLASVRRHASKCSAPAEAVPEQLPAAAAAAATPATTPATPALAATASVGDDCRAAGGVWPGLACIGPCTKAVYKHAIVGQAADGSSGEDYALPVFCVKGARPGPALLTLAGVHGDEFEPLIATQELFAALDPATLAGTWIGIGCANVSGYMAANRLSSLDGKNLARCYPGLAAGTYTERVAHTITEDFIALKEVAGVIDLHSAGKVARMATMCGKLFSLFSSTSLRVSLSSLSPRLPREVRLVPVVVEC